MLSSSVKCTTEDGFFSPDMAAEVKAIFADKKGTFFTELTGNEFMDTPPLSSGLNSMASSVAKMMCVLDSYDPNNDNCIRFADGSLETRVYSLIRILLDDFFTACGVDNDGNIIKDKAKRKSAEADFISKREEYSDLIKIENKRILSRMIDDIRIEKGIEERQSVSAPIEDPEFEKLLAEEKEAAELQPELDALRSVCRDAITEAVERNAAREALFKAVLESCKIKPDEAQRLMEAYADYEQEVNARLRELLYKRQAAYYQARWIINKEPVDGIIAKKISGVSNVRPEVLSDDITLSSLPGFKLPAEDEDLALPDTDELSFIHKLGDELKEYVTTHPYRFESQCLLSVIEETDELTEVLKKAWALLRCIDGFSLKSDFLKISDEERESIFDIWLMSDVVSRVGYTITELLIETAEKDVGEATGVFEASLEGLSYSIVESRIKGPMREIFTERSSVRVSE